MHGESNLKFNDVTCFVTGKGFCFNPRTGLLMTGAQTAEFGNGSGFCKYKTCNYDIDYGTYPFIT
jgi:hypothetical protein